MRCICCNALLTDYESTRKSVNTNEYIDMCNRCYKTVKDDILCRDRQDLISNEDVDDLDNLGIYLDINDDNSY